MGTVNELFDRLIELYKAEVFWDSERLRRLCESPKLNCNKDNQLFYNPDFKNGITEFVVPVIKLQCGCFRLA